MVHNATEDKVQLLMYCLTNKITPNGGLLFKEAIDALNFDSSQQSLLSITRLLDGIKRLSLTSTDLIKTREGTNFLCMMSAYLGKYIQVHVFQAAADKTLTWTDISNVLSLETIESESKLNSIKLSSGSMSFEPMRVIAHYVDGIIDTPVDEQVLGFIRLLTAQPLLDKTKASYIEPVNDIPTYEVLTSNPSDLPVNEEHAKQTDNVELINHSTNWISLHDSEKTKHHQEKTKESKTELNKSHEEQHEGFHNDNTATTTSPDFEHPSLENNKQPQNLPSLNTDSINTVHTHSSLLFQLANDLQLTGLQTKKTELAPTVNQSQFNLTDIQHQAKANNDKAMLMLALYHFDYVTLEANKENVKKDVKTGMALVHAAAKLNSPPAHYFLSQAYKTGWQGVEQSDDKYNKHRVKATELNHPLATQETILKAKKAINMDTPKTPLIDDRLKRPLVIVAACIIGMILFF